MRLSNLSWLVVGGALALAACEAEIPQEPAARGILRIELQKQCLKNLPAGPNTTQYNDWDEVVAQCSTNSWYIANECKPHYQECLDALREGERPTSSEAREGTK